MVPYSTRTYKESFFIKFDGSAADNKTGVLAVAAVAAFEFGVANLL